jgi:esterase/lipase superfamily enzyme
MSGELLSQLQGTRFVLGIGEHYENPRYTDAAAGVLEERGVRCDVLRWRSPAGHDWPTWRSMLPAILDAVV